MEDRAAHQKQKSVQHGRGPHERLPRQPSHWGSPMATSARVPPEANWASPSRAEQVLTVCDRVAMERGQLTDDARAANGERLMAAITA